MKRISIVALFLLVTLTAFAQVDDPFPTQLNWKLKALVITTNADMTQIAFVMGDSLGVEVQLDTLFIFTNTATGEVTGYDHPQACEAQINGNPKIETCDPPKSDWDTIRELRLRFGR